MNEEANKHRHSWLDILLAFKMAFDPKKVFLGYSGLLISLVWCVMAVSFFFALKLIETSPFIFIKLILSSVKDGLPIVVSNILPAVTPIHIGEFFVFAVIVLGLLAIWSLIGGAITRITALDYARDEDVPLIEALKFAKKKFWSFFWSPMIPVVGVFFFALCNVIGGLIGRIPVFGEIVVALGFPLALIAGFLMVFIGIIGFLGMCFMFPTISAEGSDAFDAMSRAYSYVLSRPKQYLFYCGIYILYGTICLAVVAFAAWLMIQLSFSTVGMGMGEKFAMVKSFILQKYDIACLGFCGYGDDKGAQPATAISGWSLKFLAGMLIAYIFFIKLVIWNFLVNYIFTAKTIIYFILRKEIDSTNISDVYLEEVKREAVESHTSKNELGNPSSSNNNDDDQGIKSHNENQNS